ncbi:DUF2232 domain-containing protein, partial [Mycobacterium kansasii]
MAQYALSVILFKINIIEELMEAFRVSTDQAIKMLEQMGQTPDEKLINQFETMIDMMEVLMPSMFVMASFLIVFLLQLVSFPFLKRFG